MIIGFQRLLNMNLHDLNPVVVGEAECPPNLGGGSGFPNYTLIHRVLKGRGLLYSRGGVYSVKAGQAFIILPGENASYVSDKKDPWVYQWIGFTGALSGQFAELPPVFQAPEHMFFHVPLLRDAREDLAYLLACDLFFLYGTLLQSKLREPDYIQSVVDYVQASYMNELSIQMIADYVGLNRDYLSKQFKKRRGQSIQDCIIAVRIREAKRYLSSGYSVKETAHLCGFNDACTFSRLFKKHRGISPQAWKKLKSQSHGNTAE